MGKPLDRLKKSLILNNLWLYAIKLISEKPMFSRELYEQIRSRYRINTRVITVYSILYRLEREGYITRSGNYRKYYEVTNKGKEELKSGLKLLDDILGLLK